jgi:predicted alpha/beta-hydrolase family hydrolase
MNQLSQALDQAGVNNVRFNFDYMNAALTAGKPRPPSKMPVLVEEFRKFLQGFNQEHVFIGGKSMGSRVATHLATEIPLAGVVAFGYPFHPPRKPEKLRTEHLRSMKCELLICQGERDPFGKRSEVEDYALDPRPEICWIPQGDHQFKPTKRSQASLESNLNLAAEKTAAFIRRLIARRCFAS